MAQFTKFWPSNLYLLETKYKKKKKKKKKKKYINSRVKILNILIDAFAGNDKSFVLMQTFINNFIIF